MGVGVTRVGDRAKCLSCKGKWDLSRVLFAEKRGTSRVKRSKRSGRVRVSADGRGVVSHAGVGMLRELAEDTGLSDGVTAVLADTYDGPWVHAPGRVFTDLAVAIADGGDCVSHIEVFGDRHGVCGPVASMPTTWRLLDRIDEEHLPGVIAARAAARERAWAAGAAPDLTGLLHIDVDATITISHSEDKENAAKTWKRTFGFHPLLVFLDRPEVSGGEALAGLLRPGNAGSNTAADHATVLDAALEALPAQARPCPGDPDSVRVVVRSDSAGATHAFAKKCRERGVWFSFGFAVDARIQAIVDRVPLIRSPNPVNSHGVSPPRPTMSPPVVHCRIWFCCHPGRRTRMGTVPIRHSWPGCASVRRHRGRVFRRGCRQSARPRPRRAGRPVADLGWLRTRCAGDRHRRRHS